METQDIRKEDEVHGRIKALTHQTLLSLLRTYDHESKLFYGSVQNNRSTPGTWRDSALVLMALQQGVEAMRRDRRKVEIVPMDKQDDWRRLEEDLDRGKLAEITSVIGLGEVIEAARDIIAGRIRGRIAVKIS